MEQAFETDVFETAQGELAITSLGHGSLLFTFAGRRIYVDPFSRVADYSRLPKADLVLLTHEHRDHLDPAALGAIRARRRSSSAPPRARKFWTNASSFGTGSRRPSSG